MTSLWLPRPFCGGLSVRAMPRCVDRLCGSLYIEPRSHATAAGQPCRVRQRGGIEVEAATETCWPTLSDAPSCSRAAVGGDDLAASSLIPDQPARGERAGQ